MLLGASSSSERVQTRSPSRARPTGPASAMPNQMSMNGVSPGRCPICSGVTAGWFTGINFLHFAIVLFAICTAVLVAVSLMTAPPPEDQIAGLTFRTATAPQGVRPGGTPIAVRSEPAWRRVDLLLTMLQRVDVKADKFQDSLGPVSEVLGS